MAKMLGAGMTGAGASSAGSLSGSRTSVWHTGGRAAVIGVGSVAAGFVVSSVAVAVAWVRGPADAYSPANWLSDAGLALALPCAVIAWGLAAWSLHLTRGLTMGARQFSLVLWGAATPCVYGFLAMLSFGVFGGDWAGGGLFWSATTLIGFCIWFVTLTPMFIMLIARPLLSRDPATVPASPGAAAVNGRDERDEDIETGMIGARASLREVFRREP